MGKLRHSFDLQPERLERLSLKNAQKINKPSIHILFIYLLTSSTTPYRAFHYTVNGKPMDSTLDT
jgi:hypothetical protein